MNRLPFERVAVLGAGTMGSGIAQVAAMAGSSVVLHDLEDRLVKRGLDAIARFLQKGVDKGKVEPEARDAALARIEVSTDPAGACHGADLLIEAVPEDLALKQDLFADLSRICPSGCVLASNTSSLALARVFERATGKGRCIGMHFFNPVPLMPLVEVVRTADTEPDVVDRALAYARALGKEPILVRDSPGFASSRLGVCLGLEAIRMLEQGVASAEDIDKAMVLGYGHPMGPLRLTDLIGLDVRMAIADYLHGELGQEGFRVPDLMRRMVAEGRLGKKSGRGFYEW
ncbi:MAG: 3-hydroxyacyl-CoA dehydrogenase family protein [Planctomycetota bacterium]